MSFGENLKKAIKHGAERRSLDSIKKQGLDHVRVLDERRLNEFVLQAVDQLLTERSQMVLDEERERFAGDTREAFDRLVREEQASLRRREQTEKAKQKMDDDLRQLGGVIKSSRLDPATKKAVLGAIGKMNLRQKSLLDKFLDADEERRSVEQDRLQTRIRVEKLMDEVERLKATGSASPSDFIRESQVLKDRIEELRKQVGLQRGILHNLAVNEYCLVNGAERPPIPAEGHGVKILLGDTDTPHSGIRVRYEAGNPEPVIELPEAG